MTAGGLGLVAALLAALAATLCGAAPVKQMCVVPTTGTITASYHGHFAAQFHAAQFPEFDWRVKFVGHLDANADFTPKSVVRSWVTDGTNCDVLIGPGYSYISIAMSPLVDVPWVCYSATSTELSDKEVHPSFSRVIPTDEVGAKIVVGAMLHFGWTRVAVFCVDEPYGRSVSSGVGNALAAAGGFVEISRCVEGSASKARVRSALDALRASGSRVIFLGFLPEFAVFTHVKEIVAETSMHLDTIFIFSEAFCSSADRTYTQIPGALCGTYASDATRTTAFRAAYAARNSAVPTADLLALGFPQASLDAELQTNDIYADLAHDAVLHAMTAVTRHATSGNTSSIFAYLRDQVTEGFSGTVRLDANGDRITANMQLFNVQPDGSERRIGVVANGNFAYVDRQSASDVYLLGALSTNGIPAGTRSAAGGARDVTTIVIAVVIVAVAFLAIVSVGVAYVVRGKMAAKNAPTAAPYSIVFTDVESSTKLWEHYRMDMPEAMEMHNSIIRELIAEFNAYEVKVIGDAFMIACRSLMDATLMCMEIQRRLFEAPWPDAISQWSPADWALDEFSHQSATEMPATAEGDPKSRAAQKYEKMKADQTDLEQRQQRDTGNGLWRGLRVRVGVHLATDVEAKFDAVHQRFDYYGPCVNVAARVQSAGAGGQTLLSEPALRALRADQDFELLLEDDTVIKKVATNVELKGVAEAVTLYSITPTMFKHRDFPPIGGEKVKVGGDPDAGAHLVSETSAVSHNESFGEQSVVSAGGESHNKAFLLLRRCFAGVKNPTDRSAFLSQVCVAYNVQVPEGANYAKRLKLLQKALSGLDAATGTLTGGLERHGSTSFRPAGSRRLKGPTDAAPADTPGEATLLPGASA